MKGKILIAAPVHPILLERFRDAGYTLIVQESITQKEGYTLLKDCVGVITSTRLLLDKALLEAAPDLKFIGRMGSGMEIIDVEYAASRGILCVSSPEGNCNAVAEHALGMLLSFSKKINSSYQEVKEGLWIRDANRGFEIAGKTIGIIGYGHTGPAFAKLLSCFGATVLVYDKYKRPLGSKDVVVCEDVARILEEADIISLHVPATAETKHMVNEAFINRVHKPFILINTSRGNVIDSTCLKPALASGKLKGVLLDVWEQEPLIKGDSALTSLGSDLLKNNNVMITPHIAGYSYEAVYKMSITLVNKILS